MNIRSGRLGQCSCSLRFIRLDVGRGSGDSEENEAALGARLRGLVTWIGAGLAVATLRRRASVAGAGTTSATTTTATLTVGTWCALRCGTGLRLTGGCLYFLGTLVVAVEIFFIVEVFAAIEDDGVLVAGLGCTLCGRGTLGTRRTLATVAITAAAISAVTTVTTV